MNQENKKLFAISLVPEGNILRMVYEARSTAFSRSKDFRFAGLPAAIYLGFFQSSGDSPSGMPLRNRIRSSLSGQAERLFSLFPPLLSFSRFELIRNSCYLVPDPAIPPQAALCAGEMAAEWGLCRSPNMDYPDFRGFFISRDVTPESFSAFSFYHFAIVVYSLETAGSDMSSVHWQAIAKVARKKKPGKDDSHS
ncbi:MAG: hypothetical protein LLF89_03600 [Spirochaetaceae bacterium]|nr:hypothetical protein [Spirochaetaceae bacterium]